jgi:ribosome-associated heat shock protein Hsp15
MRIDKFLWSVRIFKTRSKATDACNAGKVIINEHPVKPAKEVKPGDIINIRAGNFNKTIRIKELLKSRVAAALVPNYAEDLTPQEEYDKLKLINDKTFEWRDRGAGRPTKKDRRLIEKLKKDDRFRN